MTEMDRDPVSFDDEIYAFIQLDDETTYRQDFERSLFTSIPRQGELFMLQGPGGPLAVVHRVVWRPGGGVDLFMRPFGRLSPTPKLLETNGWYEGDDWWDRDEAPG